MKKVLFPIIFSFLRCSRLPRIGACLKIHHQPVASTMDETWDGQPMAGAMVYKTTDGGESWRFNFSDNNYFSKHGISEIEKWDFGHLW